MQLVIDLIKVYEEGKLSMAQVKYIIDMSNKGSSYEECCKMIEVLSNEPIISKLDESIEEYKIRKIR